MSFSGKRFRRVHYENIHEMLNAAKSPQYLERLLSTTAPVFSFTKNPDGSFTFCMEVEERMVRNVFHLDQEYEHERLDGSKVNITYSLESDNVLQQIIRKPDGSVAHFKREFFEKEAKMTISLPVTDVTSTIYYEIVE